MKPKTQILTGAITSAIVFIFIFAGSSYCIVTMIKLGISPFPSVPLFGLIGLIPLVLFFISLIKKKLLMARIIFVIFFLCYLHEIFWLISSEDDTLISKITYVFIGSTIISLLYFGLHGLKRLKAAETKPETDPVTE